MTHPTNHDKPAVWETAAGIIFEDCGDDLTASQKWALRSGIETALLTAHCGDDDGGMLSACCACGEIWDHGPPQAFVILENAKAALVGLFCEQCLIVRGLAGLIRIATQMIDSEAPAATHPCPGEIQ